MNTSVREMIQSDAESIVDYFVNADSDYLYNMGADRNKLPNKEDWIEKLKIELYKPYNQKKIYYIIWQNDNESIGHSNINNIVFGDCASMHLHIWDSSNRRNGNGFKLLIQTISIFFEKFKLKKLFCEPYAYNEAPNKILEYVGFEYIGSFDLVPSSICFKQTVNKFKITKGKFNKIKESNDSK